jgi:membrane protein YdbS with pleckstrin-like domain
MYKKSNKRRFHEFGNNLVIKLINLLFRGAVTDVMSGYRVFNSLFAKTMPVLSKGFEIETEMTIHALDKNFTMSGIPVEYTDRAENSFSKLDTYKDGIRIIRTIMWVFKHYKPLVFFSSLSVLLFLLSVMTGILPVMEYITEQYVYRVPMFILSVGLALASLLMFVTGLILDTVVRYNKERYEIYINDFIRKNFNRNK